jgi:hypothetical protein
MRVGSISIGVRAGPLFLFAIVVCAAAQGAPIVYSAGATYDCVANQTFDVPVRIDQADLPSGLLSMGVTLGVDPAKAQVLSVSIVSALNSDGTGAAGRTQVGAGFGKAAGFYLGAGGYTGSDLVTFHLRNLASNGSYPLSLSFYDNSPSFANFIDAGTYADIDSRVSFRGATVTAPEPVTLSLLGLGGAALLGWHRRRG